MSNILERFSWLVTVRPFITLVVLLLVTVVLGYGATLREPPIDGVRVVQVPVEDVSAEIAELFEDSGEVNVVTLVFRGDALTPGGLSQMDELVGEILSDPAVAELLAPSDPIFAPTLLFKAPLQTDGFESVTQAEIDAIRNAPGIREALASVTGTDADGTPVAIATFRLSNTSEEKSQDAERRISELAAGDEGPLRVSSLSPVVIQDEYREATETGMLPLVGLALVLIVVLLLLFMRAISDLLLTLTGLLFSLVWVIGAEGWLGPGAIGLIGPPSSLTTMVPIIVISLTVDYAIQTVSHYREQRAAGETVIGAVRTGLRNVIIPLGLAAGTTIVSLLASLFSPIGAIGDFGVIAGLGVGMSLIVMVTLLPAGRTIIDRRREARGTLTSPRPIANALPGVERMAERLGASVTRWPVPYLVVVLAITIGLGFAATGLKSEFSIRDILPRGGTVLEDLKTLEASVGGSTEMVSVLIKAEATETRTLLNVRELTIAFEDEARRPPAAAGPMQGSYELLVRDWTNDSGEPGDKYDAELAALFREASKEVELNPGLMEEFLAKLEATDPALGHVLVNNPDGVDSLLLQFSIYSDNPGAIKRLQEDIEGLWFGEDDTITATSESIIAITVTDEITDRQTEAISTTIVVALGILTIFFWVTLRQPALGVFAVGPIVLVLICVLGTMALLGIPYTLVTSIITALSIGIGVDYTIHMIHRYREEFARLRNPERAAVRTLATTGSALLGSALTTALGLGVLIASPLAASQQFGFTAAITIAYSLIFSILVIPPAMTVWGAYQNMRLRSMVRRMWEDLDLAIEDVPQGDERSQQQ